VTARWYGGPAAGGVGRSTAGEAAEPSGQRPRTRGFDQRVKREPPLPRTARTAGAGAIRPATPACARGGVTPIGNANTAAVRRRPPPTPHSYRGFTAKTFTLAA
jgi:hypothetical protein